MPAVARRKTVLKIASSQIINVSEGYRTPVPDSRPASISNITDTDLTIPAPFDVAHSKGFEVLTSSTQSPVKASGAVLETSPSKVNARPNLQSQLPQQVAPFLRDQRKRVSAASLLKGLDPAVILGSTSQPRTTRSMAKASKAKSKAPPRARAAPPLKIESASTALQKKRTTVSSTKAAHSKVSVSPTELPGYEHPPEKSSHQSGQDLGSMKRGRLTKIGSLERTLNTKDAPSHQGGPAGDKVQDSHGEYDSFEIPLGGSSPSQHKVRRSGKSNGATSRKITTNTNGKSAQAKRRTAPSSYQNRDAESVPRDADQHSRIRTKRLRVDAQENTDSAHVVSQNTETSRIRTVRSLKPEAAAGSIVSSTLLYPREAMNRGYSRDENFSQFENKVIRYPENDSHPHQSGFKAGVGTSPGHAIMVMEDEVSDASANEYQAATHVSDSYPQKENVNLPITNTNPKTPAQVQSSPPAKKNDRNQAEAAKELVDDVSLRKGTVIPWTKDGPLVQGRSGRKAKELFSPEKLRLSEIVASVVPSARQHIPLSRAALGTTAARDDKIDQKAAVETQLHDMLPVTAKPTRQREMSANEEQGHAIEEGRVIEEDSHTAISTAPRFVHAPGQTLPLPEGPADLSKKRRNRFLEHSPAKRLAMSTAKVASPRADDRLRRKPSQNSTVDLQGSPVPHDMAVPEYATVLETFSQQQDLEREILPNLDNSCHQDYSETVNEDPQALRLAPKQVWTRLEPLPAPDFRQSLQLTGDGTQDRSRQGVVHCSKSQRFPLSAVVNIDADQMSPTQEATPKLTSRGVESQAVSQFAVEKVDRRAKTPTITTNLPAGAEKDLQQAKIEVAATPPQPAARKMLDLLRAPDHDAVVTPSPDGSQGKLEGCVDKDRDVSEDDDPDRTLIASGGNDVSREGEDDGSSEASYSDDESQSDASATASSIYTEQWRASLKRHQAGLFDALVSVSHHLIRHLVDRETALEDIIIDYRGDALQLVDEMQLEQSKELSQYSDLVHKAQTEMMQRLNEGTKRIETLVRDVQKSRSTVGKEAAVPARIVFDSQLRKAIAAYG